MPSKTKVGGETPRRPLLFFHDVLLVLFFGASLSISLPRVMQGLRKVSRNVTLNILPSSLAVPRSITGCGVNQ